MQLAMHDERQRLTSVSNCLKASKITVVGVVLAKGTSSEKLAHMHKSSKEELTFPNVNQQAK